MNTPFRPYLGKKSLLVAAWLGVGYTLAACSSDAPATSSAAAAGADPEGSGKGGSAAPDDRPGPSSEGPSWSGRPAAVDATNGPEAPPDLYDPDTIPAFELTFDAAAMAILTSLNPTDQQTWVHGSFKMGAITFADIGVRRKGASTFRALPKKASLKLKLNKWVKGQKLYGLTDLTLNNMVSDATCLAERLTYHVFRSLGLPAQRANTAHVTINGENYGLYANIETPEEKFLARVFGTKAKTLYEVNSGSDWLPGGQRGFQIDVADPTAPPGTRPDVDLLFGAVQAATNDNLLSDLAPHLHTTRWLRFAAAEAVTGHRDGYAYSLYGSHNYFMAGDADGKFSLIPWSTDLTLVEDSAAALSAASPLPNTVLGRCALGASCWNAYKAEVSSVLDVYATLDLVNLATKWHAQIDALATADPKREATVGRYVQKTGLLYGWLAARPGVLRAQLGL
ncbi:MAG: hypothetical protein JWP87_5413 [Labilithrix sp.]|nr:hypothetical protein [Labilithrix sp.]